MIGPLFADVEARCADRRRSRGVGGLGGLVDGNLVFSRRPPDLPAFMRALIGVAVEAAEPVTAN
jgi:hypothetical protein